MPGQARMSAKEFREMMAAEAGGGAPSQPVKDKTVHIHTYHHSIGGSTQSRGVQPGAMYLPFALGAMFGFLAGFILALVFVGH